MRRDLWMILILGCLLILLLEAPVALSAVSADLVGPYPEVHAAERTALPALPRATERAAVLPASEREPLRNPPLEVPLMLSMGT